MFGKNADAQSAETTKVLKSGRSECYKARDAFYSCLKDCGVLYVPGTQIPVKCKQLRAAFEGSCLPSWVKHFDEQQQQAARAAKNLHTAISRTAVSSAGNLAGTPQK